MSQFGDFLSNFSSMEDLDKIVIVDENGAEWLRFGLCATLFFEEGSTRAKRLAVADVIRIYCEVFPEAISHYQKLDESRLTRASGAEASAYFAAEADAAADNDPFDFAVYGFPQPKPKQVPPLTYIGGSSSPVKEGQTSQVSSLDAYFPASWMEQHGATALIDVISRWSERLAAIHGTVGLAPLVNAGGPKTIPSRLAFPFLKRFPGLDYVRTVLWKVEICETDGRVLRTTNWLNVIDDRFVDKLGGLEDLKAALGPECPVYAYAGGVVIQAGPRPGLGDASRGVTPERYKDVARALRPLRIEAYQLGIIDAPEPLDDLDETLKWVRRFD